MTPEEEEAIRRAALEEAAALLDRMGTSGCGHTIRSKLLGYRGGYPEDHMDHPPFRDGFRRKRND